jgi:hypothetical protein
LAFFFDFFAMASSTNPIIGKIGKLDADGSKYELEHSRHAIGFWKKL